MAGDIRVCFIGDSFVQGVGDPEYRGWVGRVLQATRVPGGEVTGFNLGIRRNTSDEVLARCWEEVSRRLSPGADNRLVVSFGSNDAVEEDGSVRVAPERTLDNLTQLLTECARRGMPALVVGPPPVCSAGPAHLERLLSLNHRLEAVCTRAGVPWVPVTEALAQDRVWRAEAESGDGAHPGAGGYTGLAALVLAAGWQRWISAPGHGPAVTPGAAGSPAV
ncbi:GDSL-type esterase/lipase family protein [Peterkaempfera sp. SMS 1(5)a]|uniref:GDSL-type esterase/lipase family protein n=1 Tax=Peterkaempfera podocarpi TaxID=3232308 RepID=UPI003671C309